MFIPWRTDAPAYHRPWATIGLIAVNVLVFVGFEMPADADTITGWALVFGDGLHPLQWVSNAFLHAGILHLLGNMVFLWVFGLVVEGKIGWRRFLGAYLGIAIAQSLVVQLCMLGGHGAALGASSAITGIMAMACIWAPRNQVDCILWLVYRPFAFELPMLGVIAFFIGWDMLTSLFSGFAMSTATLHASGAAMGAPLAVLMLRKGWVDCEGWDLMTIWKHGRPMTAMQMAEERERALAQAATRERARPSVLARTGDAVSVAAGRAEAESSIRGHLAAGDGAAAAHALRRARHTLGRWDISEDLLIGMSRHHAARSEWSEAVALFEERLRRSPDALDADAVRVDLAEALLSGCNRPAKALEVLDAVRAATIGSAQSSRIDALRSTAQAQVAAGVIELDG